MAARIPAVATPQSLERAAFVYLGRQGTSTAHLRRILMRRVQRSVRHHDTDPAAGAAAVETVLAKMARLGYLDDVAFAEGRTRALHRAGHSARAIRYKLREKGVADEAIDAALADVCEDAAVDPELVRAANRVRRRRLGPYRTAQRAERRERDLAALARVGFSFEIARRVIDVDDVEALETLCRDGDE